MFFLAICYNSGSTANSNKEIAAAISTIYYYATNNVVLLHAVYCTGWGGALPRVPDAAMHVLLEPAEKLLGERYAAIGILEEWDESLELFDAALGFPNFNWTGEFLAFEEQNKKWSDDDYDNTEALNRYILHTI